MSRKPTHVLLVDDDEAMREALAVLIESWGYRVSTAGDGVAARSQIARTAPDLIVTDVVLPGMSGLDLLEQLDRDGVRAPIILITAHGSVGWAVQAMKRGAMDFLTKPVDHGHLQSLIQRAEDEIEASQLTRSLERKLEHGKLGHLVGGSAVMDELFRSVRLLARKETSAILLGESGVGKEVVARTIHDLSGRARQPFVAVNAAAIPEGLIESEVFGHEKGAFTGASASRPGCFEQADGGTLLLDEIGDMPLALQPRLLRVLEEGRARRLGGSREVEFDVRVLAATNQDIDGLLDEGKLREDLYYRLNVFTVKIPPLRDHPEDIPLLAQHFIRRFNEKHETEITGLRAAAREMLEAYRWPGNVRELRNVIERATILAHDGWIDPAHLPAHVREAEKTPAGGADGVPGRKVVLPVGVTAREAERRLIIETLASVDGNRTKAAEQLGLSPKTIYNKLKAWEEE